MVTMSRNMFYKSVLLRFWSVSTVECPHSLVPWPSVAQASFDQFIDIERGEEYWKWFYFILFTNILLLFASAEVILTIKAVLI